ncbi:hypothetical protein AYO41_02095 [Verrucomicrobia bacterium SCGC AG-212-E04]|nr:hypothetical protein AYO41_02095 [Verrucomicrobia bacterium SCGC AG-212-E04]
MQIGRQCLFARFAPGMSMIPNRVKYGIWPASFCEPKADEMFIRRNATLAYLGIGMEIISCVESTGWYERAARRMAHPPKQGGLDIVPAFRAARRIQNLRLKERRRRNISPQAMPEKVGPKLLYRRRG